VGDQTVWIVQGPYALIAAVVKGETSENLRIEFQLALEQIHLGFSEQLKDFDGNTDVFQPVEEMLSPCLKTFEQKQKQKKPYWAIAIISSVLIALATWLYFNYAANKKWSDYTGRLNSLPGIIVAESGREGGKYYIYGLKDRLSDDPVEVLNDFNIDTSKVVSRWNIYSSLSPDIVKIRADRFLNPPATVSGKVMNDTLVLTGTAGHVWINFANNNYRQITGINHLNTTGLVDSDRNEILRLKNSIEHIVFYFRSGEVDLDDEQKSSLGQLVQEINNLLLIEPGIMIVIYGQTDNSGPEILNNTLKLQRALSVKKALTGNNISENILRISEKKYSEGELILNRGNINKRIVTLKVEFPDIVN
jgi:OOP family OmpA-OmpF porin